jgi:autoinducer 2 (AI-2) kinase
MIEELQRKEAALKQQIVDVTNELFAADVITASGGNISARLEGTDIVWITPTRMFKGSLSTDDLIRVDLDGNMLEGKTRPSVEAPMHTGIMRAREDVLAVVHSHAPYATAMALCGVCVPPICFDGFLVSKLPVVPFAMSGEELAQAVLDNIGDWPGAFLQNHGMLAVGKTLRSAANLTLTVEHIGKILTIARTLGEDSELKTLPPDLVAGLEAMGAQFAQLLV